MSKGGKENMRAEEERIAMRKAMYKPGMRVKLTQMIGEEALLPVGTLGTVFVVDDCGTVHCHWDNGSSLGVTLADDCVIVG